MSEYQYYEFLALDKPLTEKQLTELRELSTRAELIGRSFPQANEAVARLAEADVLSQITVGKRNRAFEAKEIINAFTDLERQLASPGGNTRSSDPSRAVPSRRPHTLLRVAH